METRINDKIDLFGSVLVTVYSQYEPNKLIDSLETNNVNEAIDFTLYYANDYVYYESPE